jgi:hypothetical protein
MLFFSFILHMLGAMALSSRFLTLNSSSSTVLGVITFIFTLLIGGLIALLVLELGEKSPNS